MIYIIGIGVVVLVGAFVAGYLLGGHLRATVEKKIVTPAEIMAQKAYDAAHADAQARVNVLVATANKAGIKVDPIVLPKMK